MRVSNRLRLHSTHLSRVVQFTNLLQVKSFAVSRMANVILPLLWGMCVILQQCHNVHSTTFEQTIIPETNQGAYNLQGNIQFYEPYKTPQSVSTSFINQPISSINPYPKFETGVERSFQTVDSASFVQPISSGSIQSTYKLQDGTLIGQQQPFFGTGQLSQMRLQPSSTEYIPVAPQTRAITTTQQVVQPNFVYTLSNQGQLVTNVERTVPVSLPVQQESLYPTSGQYMHQSARVIPMVQFTPKYMPPRTSPAAPPPISEEVFPLSNPRVSQEEGSQTIFIGGKPFVITSLKPKSAPVPDVQSVRNPLESIRAEVLQSLLNRIKGDVVHKNQIVVKPNSDSSVLVVTEAPEVSRHQVSRTPVIATKSTTEPTSPSSSTPKIEKITPMSTPPPIPTTTLPPPPTVHTEMTTIEERYYVSKKKKITIAIRVEDAGSDAVEKDYYSTNRNTFYDWSKTILEPTNTYETSVYMKNEIREVEGPSFGLNGTKFVCRSFVDGEEITVVEQDPTGESTTCRRPESKERDSWEAKAFSRVENEIHKKLEEIFNVSEMPYHSSGVKPERIAEEVTPTRSELFSGDSNTTPDFLTKTLNAFKSLNLDKPHYGLNSLKRDTETSRHLADTHNFLPTTTEAKLSSEVLPQQVDLLKTTPIQTSKREAKPEVLQEFKLKDLKSKAVTEDVVPTTHSHIMLITKTLPVGRPHPYPHPSTKNLPHSTKIESFPVSHVQRSMVIENVPAQTVENKELTFFRRS